MADVMSRAELFSPSRHRPAPLSCKKGSSPSLVGGLPLRSSLHSCKAVRSSSRDSGFHGRKLVVEYHRAIPMKGDLHALPLQMSLSIGKGLKWWEKGIQPNMKEVQSAQDLVDSLLNAGNKLVVVDFFSPGCGGCKALHPKICQFAEMNPDLLFLQINYEEHKPMCYTLNVHVLPFFRFYRGAQGRVCNFSCTNATIKKFRDALAKHGTDRCSLGPARGLEESELMGLAANRELSFNYAGKALPSEAAEPVSTAPTRVPAVASNPRAIQDSKEEKEKAFVTAWR